jgi:hypothetical protein
MHSNPGWQRPCRIYFKLHTLIFRIAMPTSAELPTVVSPDIEAAGSPPSQRLHARQQTYQTQTSALPPLDGRAASPEHGGVDIETKRLRAGIVPSLTEMERLRNIIYEKNRDIFQLKQEITVLKQIERRQQRDLDHLQHDEDEAPRIIRMMREEAQGLKVTLLGRVLMFV